MDVERLQETIATHRPERVRLVMTTVTNSTGGGQPVSLKNLRAVRRVCNRHGILFFLDRCRFAENAWFIRQRGPGQGERSARDIARGCSRSPTG
ncbi:MAG: beta-eliminating lyase-related protein [Actinomycetota bacterium]